MVSCYNSHSKILGVHKLVEFVQATLIAVQGHTSKFDFVPETSSKVADMELDYASKDGTMDASRLDMEVHVVSPTLGLSVLTCRIGLTSNLL